MASDEKSYIQRQREKRAAFERRRKESGRSRSEQREFDQSNSAEAVQERRDRATAENARNLRESGLSDDEVRKITGVGEITVVESERGSSANLLTESGERISGDVTVERSQSIKPADRNQYEYDFPIYGPPARRDPNRFGATEITSARSRALQQARIQQNQDVGLVGGLLIGSGLARKATPQEVVDGAMLPGGRVKTQSGTDFIRSATLTGAISDVSSPFGRIGRVKAIAPEKFFGASETSKASRQGRSLTLRKFEGVVSDAKGAKRPANVREIKVDASGLVFREERVGRKTSKSVFLEKDLFTVSKRKSGGRTVTSGLRQETDISNNELRRILFDQTQVTGKNAKRARVGGSSQLTSEKRLKTTLGGNKRGAVGRSRPRLEKPKFKDLDFTRAPDEFVRPPSVTSRPQLNVVSGLGKATAGLGLNFLPRGSDDLRLSNPSKLDPRIEPRFKPDFDVRNQPRFKPSFFSPTKPARKTTPTTRPGQVRTPRTPGPSSRTPPPPPIIPIVPFDFSNPNGDIESKRRKKGSQKRSKRKSAKTPSLLGLDFDVGSKRDQSLFTGLEVRF